MSMQRDAEPTYAAAVERFRQGQCPGCGKGSGQPRGLEYRKAPDDLYCHTCKVSWPTELDTEVLCARFSNVESPEIQTYDAPSNEELHEDAGVVAKLSRLFRKILMR